MAMLAPAAGEKADALASAYRRIVLRRLMVLALAATGLLLSFLLDVATGPARLPLGHVAASVFRLAEDSTIDAIVWNIRLPVAVIALLVGACLGLSGVIMQTILNNPLASSYTLGVSAGAGFGAGLVILMGSAIPLSEAYAIPLNAFLFAGIACAGVYFIGKARGATPEMLVLAGIAMLFLFQALLALLQFMASPEALQSIVFWLFGSLQKATWPKNAIIAVVLAATIPVMMHD
ncbi:MAG: FecCD family ABC transporter permease, partial [bacterium]